MKNVALKIQCDTLVTSIELFKQCSMQACLENDGTICKDERKFLDKVNRKIDALIDVLKNSP